MWQVRLQVREVAESQGYNITTLARAAQLNIETVRGLWHNHVRRLDLDTFSKVATTLSVDPRDLIRVDPVADRS